MAQTLAMAVAPSLSAIRHRRNPTRFSSKLSFPSSNPPKVHGLSICCARVGGVEIPDNKRIEYSLQYIHGIGHTLARHILTDIRFENKITKDLTEEELVIIRDEVNKYVIEGELREINHKNIKILKEIQCYRGRRHILKLPCRGQRKKNNARTLKGERVAVPGKKKPAR